MKTKKRTLISTETHEALTIRLNLRPQPPHTSGWCEECATGAPLLTPEDAAPLARLSVRAVYRLVEDKQVHFKQTPSGQLLVCLNNLSRQGPQ